jgi:hypothetical protein
MPETAVPLPRPSLSNALRASRPLARALTHTLLAVFSVGAVTAVAQEPAPASTPAPAVNAGPYVPSPEGVISEMLDMAGVGPGDELIDMGSGDGRIVLTAVKLRGARGLGIEIQEPLVALSNAAAKRDGIADRARFVRQDLFKTDVSSATVVTLYLLPDTVNMLSDKLRRELKPGTRVLSHDYPIAGWLPEAWKRFDEPTKVDATGIPSATVYLYRVPASVDGPWRAQVPAAVAKQPIMLALRQQWQKLDGFATVAGREVALEAVDLRGEQVSFQVPLERGRVASFTGLARNGAIDGTVSVDGSALPWRATSSR